METEFMMKLQKQLIDEKHVCETTANAYIKSLFALNDKKPFKNLSFLKKTEDVEKIIETYAENTKRALYATVSSVLGLFKDQKGFKKVHKYYFDKAKKRDEPNEEVKHTKTKKQEENWISWEDINKKKDELLAHTKSFGKTIDGTQYETLLQGTLLSLFCDIAPRRNKDYLEMYVVKKSADLPNDKNYLDVSAKKFIFNLYKTSKKYGSQSVDIPETLMSTLNTFLKYHPLYKIVANRKEPVKLLVNYDGSPITAVNGITRILNKIFGKKVSSSLLRHVFLSDKYSDTINKMESDAKDMGHSTAMQSDYIKN